MRKASIFGLQKAIQETQIQVTPKECSRKERIRGFKDKHCKTFEVTWQEL